MHFFVENEWYIQTLLFPYMNFLPNNTPVKWIGIGAHPTKTKIHGIESEQLLIGSRHTLWFSDTPSHFHAVFKQYEF